jgi:hypothetical protein
MGLAARATNHVVMSFTLTETQRKAVINATYLSGQDVRKLEDWFEMQQPCFVIMGINHDSCNTVVWVTS